MAIYYVDPSIDPGDESDAFDGGYGSGFLRDSWADVTWAADGFYYQARGTTYSSRVTISSTGTSGHPITIGAYGTGAKPIIDVASGDNLCLLGNATEYIEISDIVVKNANATGMQFLSSNTKPGNGIIISRCEAYNCVAAGLYIGDQPGQGPTTPVRTGAIIQDCYAFNCGKAGVAIEGGSTGAIIRNCEAVECCQSGNSWGIYMRPRGQNQQGTWSNISGDVYQIDLATSGSFNGEGILRVVASGRRTAGAKELTEGTFGSVGPNEWAQDVTLQYLQIDIQEDPYNSGTPLSINIISANLTDCIIENCIATDTENGSGAYDGVGIGQDIGPINGIIRNNISTGSKGGGISDNFGKNMLVYGNICVGNESGLILPTSLTGGDNRWFNNTCVDNTYGAYVIRNEQATLNNNIFTGSTYGIYEAAETTYGNSVYTNDYNCFYNNTTNIFSDATANSLGSNDITSNPLLNSTYHLASISPAINAGTFVANAKDYAGKSFAVPPSIGAYEYTPVSHYPFLFSYGSNVKSNLVQAGGGAGPTPLLYREDIGVIAPMTAGYINAFMGVGWSGKIVALGANGDSWYFDGSTWAQTDSDVTGASAAPASIFLDSNGYVYAGFADTKLYRTIDNGVTWTIVHTFTDANSYASQMCEDSNGWLYAGGYVPGGSTIELMRSKDSGATWTDIAANLASSFLNHVHGCFWDHHHDALIVAGGDAGVSDDVQVSFDFGETFFNWSITWQMTGITFDADYVYMCSDLSTDRNIYRVKVGDIARTEAAWNAATLEKILDPVAESSAISDITGIGFAWWGFVDDQGTVYFPYGKNTDSGDNILWASTNQGVTWAQVHNDTTTAARFAHESVFVSHYQTGWDGCWISESSGDRGPYRWRIVRGRNIFFDGTQLEVNESTGAITGDGITNPFSAFPEVDGMTYQLMANYTANFSTGMDNSTVYANGFTLGTAETGALIIDEDFEGESSLAAAQSTGVVVTQDDATQPYTGTKACLIDLTGGSSGGGTYGEVKKTSGIAGVSGEVVWASCRAYCDSASWAANIATRLPCSIRAASFQYVAQPSVGTGGDFYLTYYDGATHSLPQTSDSPVALPLQTYFHIKGAVYVHATEGWIKYWINGKLLFHVVGINTFNSSNNITQAAWGVQSANLYKWYVDDCKCSKGFDPEKPDAINLEGTGTVVIP